MARFSHDISWVRKEVNMEGAEAVAVVLVCVFVHMAMVDVMNETRRCREEEFATAEGKK